MAGIRDIVDAVLAIPNGVGVTRRISIVRPANTTAYTANDVIVGVTGATTTPNVIRDAVRFPGGSAYLHGITVYGDQGGGGGAETWQPKVWIAQRQRPLPLADNAAFTESFGVAQQTGFLTEQLLPALATPAAATVDKAVLDNLSVLLTADAKSKDLHVDLQTLTAFTPASGALYEIVFQLVQL